MGKHTELGRNGEILAADFLMAKGHTIVCANYRFEHREIDIISLDRDVIVFTEIKTRSNYNFGYPEEAVTARKQALIKSAAEHFLFDYPESQKVRFDVISIMMKGGKAVEILHFEDAFY